MWRGQEPEQWGRGTGKQLGRQGTGNVQPGN
jgi:hypothetical protein